MDRAVLLSIFNLLSCWIWGRTEYYHWR